MDTDVDPELQQRFSQLARQWHGDTAVVSSTTTIFNHPAYLEIIAIGKDAIPLILKDLYDNGGDWFAALSQLTGEDPVRESDYGFMRRMKAAWLRWADENGYVYKS